MDSGSDDGDQPPERVCAPAPPGLVGWWRAEGDASDSAGSSDGVLLGAPVFGEGLVDEALDLDGADDALRVDLDARFYPADSFSIEAWVATTQQSSATLIDHYEKGGSSCVAPGCRALYALRLADGAPVFVVRSTDGDDGLAQFLESATQVADGGYHHIVAVRSVEDSELELYIDGALDTSAPLEARAAGPLEPGPDEIDPLVIGAGRALGGELTGWLRGTLDEVGYYDRELDPGEVADIHAAGDAGKCR